MNGVMFLPLILPLVNIVVLIVIAVGIIKLYQELMKYLKYKNSVLESQEKTDHKQIEQVLCIRNQEYLEQLKKIKKMVKDKDPKCESYLDQLIEGISDTADDDKK